MTTVTAHSNTALRYVDGATVFRLVPIAKAVEVVRQALLAGLVPRNDPPRSLVSTHSGQLLLMPSEFDRWVGVKIASVVPGNTAVGRPRVQAIYVLLDAETLTPRALIDGNAVTVLRTAAVSAVAVDYLADPAANRLTVFGTGPQAWAHIQSICAVRPIDEVAVVGRDACRTRAFAERVEAEGLNVRLPSVDAVLNADIVLCATTATEPLFEGKLVAPHACVVAIGSHEPGVRELDEVLMGVSSVIVEDQDVALREAGDVIQAVAAGTLHVDDLLGLADVVTGRTSVVRVAPRVFKSVGMSWEDLVVAVRLFELLEEED